MKTMAVSRVSSTNYYTQAALTSEVSVSVAIAALKTNPKLKVKISDTTENISRNLGTLNAYANNLTQVAQTDNATVMTLSEPEFSKYSKLLAKFTTNYQLEVIDTHAANASTLADNTHVSRFSINDTSANISNRLDALQGLSHFSKISKITVSTPAIAVALTAGQFEADTNLLGKMFGNYSLAISDASAAAAVGYAGKTNIKSVAVLDTAAAISSHLDGLVDLGLRLKEVRGSDSNLFTVSASQMQTDGLVIGRLYKGYQLSVLGASMAQTAALTTNKKVVTVAVEDTAANITSSLAMLDKMGSSLTTVHVTDVDNALQLNSAQLNAYADVLEKIVADDDYQLTVTQASAMQAQVLLDKAHVASISVMDSAQAVSAVIDQLQANDKVTDIAIAGKTTELTMSYAQLMADSDAIGKINSNYVLNVKEVPASEALDLMTSHPRISSMGVTDTTSNLTTHLSDLASLGGRLTSIRSSDNGTFAMTEAQWRDMQPVMDKVTNGYGVTLSEVTASDALLLVRDSRVQSVAVKDTGAGLSAVLDGLNSLGAQLTSIEQTDTSNSVTVTASQWSHQASTLAKFGADTRFSVRGASARQVTLLAADERVTSIAIADTSSNIAASLDAIQAAMTNLADANRTVPVSIRQLGTPAAMRLTAEQLTADAGALAAMSGPYSLNISGAEANSVATIAANKHVASLTVKDTGAAIVGKLPVLASLGNKLANVQQTNLDTPLDLTLTQWSTYSNLLKKFQYGVHANVSGVSAAQAQTVLMDSRVDHVSVTDTVAQVSAKLNGLEGLGPNLTSITLSDGSANAIQLNMQQFNTLGTTLGKIASSYKLAVTGASAADAQTLLDANAASVETIAVADTNANIVAALEQLNANNKLTGITQTGVAQPLSLTAAQIAANDTALTKMVGSYSLAVVNALASDVASLSSNSHVASISISDSATHVQDQMADLNAAMAKVVSVSLTDTHPSFNLTYSQWSESQAILEKINNDFTVAVSEVAAAKASVIAASSFVSSISVSDTTSHVRSSLDALASVLPKLDTVTLTDADTAAPMNISMTQYNNDAAVLGKIVDANYTLNVTAANVNQAQMLELDDQVVGMTVVDSSQNIATNLADLTSNSKLSRITNSTPATPMILDSDLFTSSAATLAKVNSYQAIVQHATVDLAANLDENTHIVSFDLSDTSTYVSAALASLSTLSSKLASIRVTQDDAPITVSQAALNDFAGENSLINTLAKVSGDYRLSLTGVSADNLDLLLPTASGDSLTLNPGASDPFVISLSKIASVAVSDTSANISAVFDSLTAMGSKLDSLTLSDVNAPIALASDQFSAGSAVLSRITGGTYHLALVDVLAQDAVSLAAEDHVDTVSVADTADNIASNFDALQAIEGNVADIEVLDGNDLVLTQAQFDSALASKVLGATMVVSG